ncbi:DMT family transporter [Ochrobactrum vermis]|uniref:DMT family transporter n=1 Tax=Ochrobactrum vermis TaxID=1827297 RepID=A0ABU8PD62_9HYPH|nr:DMT family transporter [Ochrobactrum vermis]PQZ30541.1 EamA family transporter [Ochrobactrum vermis]
MRIAILTAISMLAFAANSLLARLALSNGDIDPLSYTGLRLVSGAVVLFALACITSRRTLISGMGNWSGAFALLFYAGAFSTAYVMIGAATGALILFASVQIGMIAWAIFWGDRPAILEWMGIAIAFLALLYLISPGLVAPKLSGTVLMMGAGLSWAAYSLLGRGSQSPLFDTAGNFVRCLPVGIIMIIVGLLKFNPTLAGATYAVVSGAIASGLGYTIWYNVLPELSRTRAALVQLTVPSIAALGGVLILGEPLSQRLLIATIGIVGGVALALLVAKRRTRVDDGPEKAN